MNYEGFKQKCVEKGYSPSSLLQELGINKGNVTKWKKGVEPNHNTLIMLSEKLECSVEYLMKSENDVDRKNNIKVENNKYLQAENSNVDEKISCPFCGKRTVTANIVASFYGVVKNVPIFKDGVNVNLGNLEEISKPSLKCSNFYCSSCDKKWYPFQCKLVIDDNGECSFVDVKKKGDKIG